MGKKCSFWKWNMSNKQKILTSLASLLFKTPKRPSLNFMMKTEEIIRIPNNWAMDNTKYDIGLF